MILPLIGASDWHFFLIPKLSFIARQTTGKPQLAAVRMGHDLHPPPAFGHHPLPVRAEHEVDPLPGGARPHAQTRIQPTSHPHFGESNPEEYLLAIYSLLALFVFFFDSIHFRGCFFRIVVVFHYLASYQLSFVCCLIVTGRAIIPGFLLYFKLGQM